MCNKWIDVLACAITFAELYNCDAVLPGAFNLTIPESVRKWDLNFRTEFDTYDEIVIVDISNPKYISQQISENKIIKVFDPSYGIRKLFGKSRTD